jgi:phospholipase/carboxylesterase
MEKNLNKSEAVLNYLTREPKLKTEKPPILILLHGVGSNEYDLFSFADQLPDNFLVVSARAPYTLGNNSYAWYQVDFSTGKPVFNKTQEEKSRNTIIQFIGDLKQSLLFDDRHVFLGGFSQGAIMSYSVGLTRPDLVKGIFIMSGRLLDEVKPQIASGQQLENLFVFMSHGKDDQTLGFQYANAAYAYLKTLNLKPSFNLYEGGHFISREMLSDLVTWLSEQVKK